MGRKKKKEIVDTAYDASKDENIKRQNSFLVVCVCSILFILMLCYFGINSFKGTAAVTDTVYCLNGRTEMTYNNQTYCCPSGYNKVMNIDGVSYCMNADNTGFTHYLGTNVFEASASCDEAVAKGGNEACNIVYNGCVDKSKTECDTLKTLCYERETTCTPSDNYVCIISRTDGFKQGILLGGTISLDTFKDIENYGSNYNWRAVSDEDFGGDNCVIEDFDGSRDSKTCSQCYNLNHVAEYPIDTEKTGYCIKNNNSGIYYYGQFTDIGNYSLYTNVIEFKDKEIECLSNNTYTLEIIKNNAASTGFSSTTTVKFNDSYELPDLKKTIYFTIETDLGVNLVNNLPDRSNVNFVGWKLHYYGHNAYEFAEYSSDGTAWKKFTSSTAVVTDAKYVRRLESSGKRSGITAVWEQTTINLPTITKDGYTCSWLIEDGVGRAEGTTFPSGSKYTIYSEASTQIKLTGTCTVSGSSSTSNTSSTSSTNTLADDQYVCFSGPAEGYYWALYGEHKDDPDYVAYESMDWLACRNANGGELDPDAYMPAITVDAGNGYIAESDDIVDWTPNMKKYTKSCLISGTNTSCSVDGEVDAVFSGKTFKGWGTSKNCTNGKKVSEYVVSNNTTLYACWAEGVSEDETDDVAVGILLDANGGYIKESDDLVNWSSTMQTYTKSCIINSNRPECSVAGEVEAVLSGKMFKGWAPSKDCTSGKKVSEYSVSKNTTLYACWVSSNTANQVEKPSNSLCRTRTYNGSNQVITSATSGTGYTLTGYNQKDAGTYTVTATLLSGYEWKDGTTGTVSFKCSIAKASPSVTIGKSSLTVNEGSETTFTEKANVAGSFVNVSGKTNIATVNPGSYSSVAANTTRTVSVVGVAAGTSVVKVTFTPTDTKNYNSTDVSVTVKVNGSSTVAPATYTITYNKNGGTGSMNTSSCTYGNSCTLRANSFTRDGYTFVGWTTTPSSTIVIYNDKQTFTYDRDANLTLYAVWASNDVGNDSPTTYTATFNSNGGTLNGDPNLSCTASSNSCEVTGLPTASKSGYTFKGWGESSSCSAGNSTKLTLSKDTTYYACWEKNAGNSGSQSGEGEIKNPQTGEGMIVFVAILGVAAISYLVYYYKKFQNN